MQTFLPYADFIHVASVLDYKRLGKQRIEADQCLAICRGRKSFWMSDKQFEYAKKRYKNGPVVKLWKGHEPALRYYINCIIDEWKRRGYKNKLRRYHVDKDKLIMPPWLGNEKLHSSHRAALLKKNYTWYKQFNWKEEPKIEYIWDYTQL